MGFNELLLTQPWLTENVVLPHPPPGCLGSREAQLFYFLGKDSFTGSGTIVDAGSFLGKSAYLFAEGLRANPRYIPEQHRVHCFDHFLVNDDHDVQFIRNTLLQTVAIGDSTRQLFTTQVAPVLEVLEIHEGDFNTISWTPQPVEILMVDIAKSKSLGKRVVELFFPCLIPGESVVIQQDYHHPWHPHIHVMMEFLAAYFELVIPRLDDSAVFRYRKAIPAEVLQRAIAYSFSPEEQSRLMNSAVARLSKEDRYYVQLAKIVLDYYSDANRHTLQNEFEELYRSFQGHGRDFSPNQYFEQVSDLFFGTHLRI